VNQSEAPLLDALAQYHHLNRYGFTPPGHRQGRGVDPRVLAVLGRIQLDTVMLPRDAFFGAAEQVPATEAVGRIAAEQITPYPPGIPAVVPGERLNDAVLDYLRSGVTAGMNVPDPADPSLQTLRVVAQ
jgi:arginine/lysine/ornithine decarboxylase